VTRFILSSLIILTCSFNTLFCQFYRDLSNTNPDHPIVITMAIPHFEAELAFLALEGTNLGQNLKVFLGGVAGVMEPLSVLSSSDNYIEAALPEISPGTYLLLVSSEESEGGQLFALYVSLVPPHHSVSTDTNVRDHINSGVRSKNVNRIPLSGRDDEVRQGQLRDLSASPTHRFGEPGRFMPSDPTRPIPFDVTVLWKSNGNRIYYNKGNVGIGTPTPQTALHISRSNGTARLSIEEKSLKVASRMLLELKNYGGSRLVFRNTKSNILWTFTTNKQDHFYFSRSDTGGAEFILRKDGQLIVGPGAKTVFNLKPNGDLTINGTLSTNGVHLNGNITSDGEICIGSGC